MRVVILLLGLSCAIVAPGPRATAAENARTPPPPTAPPSTATGESVVVHARPRPSIMLSPTANPIGQPIRMGGAENRKNGNPYDWGVFNRGDGEAAGFGPVGRYGVAPGPRTGAGCARRKSMTMRLTC